MNSHQDETPEVKSKNKIIKVLTGKKYAWVFVGILFILAAAFLLIYISHNLKVADTEEEPLDFSLGEPAELMPADMRPRLLDGVFVDKNIQETPIYAVMIDNHRDAWPPAGLSQARLVIEAEAEGGMTRYLAFYNTEQAIDKIGPVRSARPYFIDWAAEWSALYVHVGGSPAALAKMVKEDTLHINEFYNEFYFWRDRVNGRFAPHNVFTSSELMRAYLQKREVNDSPAFSWLYKNAADYDQRPATHTIAVDYELIGYDVAWEYNRDDNEYVRYLGGDIHQDEDGEWIKAANVVLMRVSARTIDQLLRLEMDNIGSGEAMVCQEGACQEAIWKKPSKTAKLRFYDEEGSEEIELIRGTTWVEAVRPEISVNIQ